ncbi:hypothetical protein BDR07DRAFT_1411952 [Suillus spraguei]|nr:hypothetical protein BDR07DRAFT_1411952 [Suillus spraguei]
MGVDVSTFSLLLTAGFAQAWYETPIPREDVSAHGTSRIDKRSLDAAGALGLVLHYLNSTIQSHRTHMRFLRHHSATEESPGLWLPVHDLYMIEVFVEPSDARGGHIHSKKIVKDPALVTVQRERAKPKWRRYKGADFRLRDNEVNFTYRARGFSH